MTWSPPPSPPSSPGLLSEKASMERQSWSPRRSRSPIRGKRGLAPLLALILIAIVVITTMTLRPTYTADATAWIQKQSAQRFKDAQTKLKGTWTVYEEKDFPVSNPTITVATTEEDSGLRQAHPELEEATFDPLAPKPTEEVSVTGQPIQHQDVVV
ncbi:hypothetical protein Slin15195_G099280 [Septoria linicola]|uniref:Uncharacterized protein n=1 Tax=Septoria linicola TaxID=215465 RepID=A0A9Q9ENI1_9PEZI|nr:hypothetical protein Slin14017_G062340 [Septoria linicola]USW56609.1 hypothetical protein Slin15195_G099280 [Septoria linicola]